MGSGPLGMLPGPTYPGRPVSSGEGAVGTWNPRSGASLHASFSRSPDPAPGTSHPADQPWWVSPAGRGGGGGRVQGNGDGRAQRSRWGEV